MKNKIKKIAREITMLTISFACGLFIFIGVLSVYAAWDDKNSGDAFTADEYMDLVWQVKSWIRPATGNTIQLGTSAGIVDMQNGSITNLVMPTSPNPRDVTNKAYVDNMMNAPAGTLCGLYMITESKIKINKPCIANSLSGADPICPDGFTLGDLGYFEAGSGTRAWRTCVKD